jgi:DUF1680 family protein
MHVHFFIKSILIFLMLCTLIYGTDGGLINTSLSPYVKLRSIDIDDVHWTDGFWADKFNIARKITIPTMWKLLSDPNVLHAWQNLQIIAGKIEGDFRGTYWQDGDFYKWLEASAYTFALTKNKDLDQLMDKIIEVISLAQAEDGYLHTPTMIGKGTIIWEKGERPFDGTTKRWDNLKYHELYSMGHLLTAGCIHFRSTGKKTLLEVAIKCAEYLYEVFYPKDSRMANFGFNPSYIMGTMELYRTTKNKKYLDLAEIFLDMRGSSSNGSIQNQNKTPFREESEAVGHAVTANYLYAGAADIYSETGDRSILDALQRIWYNVTEKKMYITGATGAVHNRDSKEGENIHEAYGYDYELPNSTAYNETCANIANAMWNYRMLTITGDAAYADVMELVLYNSALSGISLDGKHYFYTNPLRRLFGEPFLKWDKPTRQPFLECFCCPSNIARTIVETNAYAYSISDEGIWIHLYGSSKLNTELANELVIELSQYSEYPWDGNVKIRIDNTPIAPVIIRPRIPGWARGAELYINGNVQLIDLEPGTYPKIKRRWAEGDILELRLPMPIEFIQSHPRVEENKNHIAIKRGPIVYCLESVDLPDSVRITDLMVTPGSRFNVIYTKDILGGVVVLEGDALFIKKLDWKGRLYNPINVKPINIRLIPYYSWSNRGVSEMTVWLPSLSF